MFFIDADSAPALPAMTLEPLGKSLVYSATDLVTSAQCQFAALYTLDQLLGRVPRLERVEDPQLRRAAALGEAHEQRVLNRFIATYGSWDPARGQGIYEVQPPQVYTRQALEEKHAETLNVLQAGADVVFQASFFDGSFHGRADFLVKQPDGGYRVVDTKLARTARVPALLQVAAYADQLQQEGIACDPFASLILGNDVESLHELATLTPVFEQKHQRLLQLLTAHRAPGTPPVSWFVEPGSPEITRCGRCDTCRVMVQEHRDMLLTAGMTARSRQAIYERCGVQSIDELASLAGQNQLPGLVRRYAEQAALQTGKSEPDGTATVQREGQEHTLSYKLFPRHSLRMLPRASAGDLFISLLSDPLWHDGQVAHPELAWGLTYGLGAASLPEEPGAQPLFSQFWAANRSAEGRLLADFLGMLHHQRQLHPGLRVYYFGAATLTALQQLAAMHGTGEAYLTDLQRDGVLLDLSEVLRRSMRISTGTRVLADIEPLYATGLEPELDIPVTAFADMSEAEQAGKHEQVEAMRGALARSLYRTGLSLAQLRSWLLELAGRSVDEELVQPAPLADLNELLVQAGRAEDETEAERALRRFVEALDAGGELEPQKQAVAMVATATGYHRRERRQFWWDHFNRLTAPREDWEDTRDVVLLGRLQVVADWHRPERARSTVRLLSGVARLAPGSSVKVGDSGLFAMYARPFPPFLEREARQQALTYAALHEGVLPVEAERAGAFNTEIVELEEIPEHEVGQPNLVRLTVRESLKASDGESAEPYSHLPMALTPGQPIPTQAQEQSLLELAARTARVLPELPAAAGTDLVRRRPPRLVGGSALPRPRDFVETHGSLATVQAIYQAVSQLDRSYVAVQGPPGSGKTFVGSHVIGRLVAAGWKVGIVAQSHAVVENMLLGCISNGGVDPDQIAKGAGKSQTPNFPWREVRNPEVSRFMDEPGGRVFGGTAWDFASDRKFRFEGLDLLVIDEAGQYSLANTLAVARSAKNLLLLGDPAQLPQVTQGTHPYPVDESALGWLSAGRTVLPEEFGYFLDVTWRMHPALCAPVSALSYEGRLASAPSGTERHLEGWEPGVYLRTVEHRGNSTASVEEADEIVALVRRFLGHLWVPHLAAPEQAAPLVPSDIIVVAAYNAQVDTIRAALLEAGLADADGGGVRVGTVDKFQGQEAPVVLVSMAASSAGDSPRGTDFLLSPNRLNVALSRGMWAAVVVCSTRFTDFMPTSPEALALLGAFIRLEQAAQPFPTEGEAGVRPDTPTVRS
ncbi:MAG: AAA domain-containing protein [Rothia sp. (in: high G+C Gram-positive bacteria)]|uniref:AAA domain-containing protein n=1 Tax=Rothia sp. (in: high G+C Gram-positive bacteria) TaxID=1885016 RepID=UPI0027082AD1|nr:AAA domain-containing protein [Rothia sp. (in: high G+C Gram-positive bacteria)]